MEIRTLGKTGLRVSALGLGAAEIGFGNVPAPVVDRMIGQAFEEGINVVDTGECYASSEELLGKVLGKRRDQLHLFTKCGHSSGLPEPDWSPALLERSLERSLKRLSTDRVDVLFLHSCDESVLRKGDAIEVLVRAKAAGKARFLGYSGDRMAARHAIASGAFDVLQISVNIADQEAIDGPIPAAKRKKMGVVAKRPLANVAWRWPKLPPDPYHHAYWERLRKLDFPFLVGDLPDAVRISLAFSLRVPGVHTAIVGTANPNRIRQNAVLLSQANLPDALFTEIRERWRDVAQPGWTGQE